MKTQIKLTLLASVMLCAGNVFAAAGTTTAEQTPTTEAPMTPKGDTGGGAPGAALYNIAVTLNTKTQLNVNTCTGVAATCNTNQVLNAVGVPIVIDLTNITSLGTISADKVVSLSLPLTRGATKVYSFTPTKGDMAGQKITFALDNVPPTGRYVATGDLINVYRREGTTGQNWIDVGNFTGNISALPAGSVVGFVISPDGTMNGWDPRTQTFKTIMMGTRNV